VTLKHFIWAALFILGSLLPPLDAAPGQDASSFLQIPVGGRPAGLGGAYSTLATDAYASIWNPAGLGFSKATQLAAMHLAYVESISYEFIGLSRPFGKSQGFGFGLQYFHPDDIPITDISGTTQGTFSGSSGALSLSYGQKMNSRFSLGLTGRLIRSKLEDESAQAVGMDIGGLIEPAEKLRLAAVLANVGTKIKFIDQEDALPVTFRLGGAYVPDPKWILSLEGAFRRSEGASVHSGVEWNPLKLLSVRAGYRSDPSSRLSGMTGFSTGMGVNFLHQRFDYTLASLGDLGLTHYFSLMFEWLPVKVN
jgi:hypothetical protein